MLKCSRRTLAGLTQRYRRSSHQRSYATSSPVSIGIGDDLWRVYRPGVYPGHSGPLSLAIPPWVGAMSTGDGFGHLWAETAPLKLRPYGAIVSEMTFNVGLDVKPYSLTHLMVLN